MENLSLRMKALIPIAIMSLTIAAMVAIAAVKLANLSAQTSEMVKVREEGVVAFARLGRSIASLNADVAGSLLFESDSDVGKVIVKDFDELTKNVATHLGIAETALPEKKSEVDAFRKRFDELRNDLLKPFQIGAETPSIETGRKLTPEDLDRLAEGARLMRPAFLKVQQFIMDLREINNRIHDENVSRADALESETRKTLITLILAGIFATLGAGGFSSWISNSQIARPLSRLGSFMSALANGEYSIAIEGTSRRDEIGSMARAVQVFKDNGLKLRESEAAAAEARAAAEKERLKNEEIRAFAAEEQARAIERLAGGLKSLADGDLTSRLNDGFASSYLKIRDDFNEAANKLRETMVAIVSSTQAIRSGTKEISTASDDLSRRTEQQAASLEETAAALDEITKTVQRSAENAASARKAAAAADEDAKSSALIVSQAVKAMTAISASSQQVTQIISVIDEIAFQTNLLALNAGVEAARAGSAGRGFAVVASEVRALAQRSAEAAKEIKELIFSSSAQVDNGVKLVGEAGSALDRIIKQVIEINRIVAEIAASAGEQATGLAEINSAINQMDQVTQQNAAMVEESTAASYSLSEETSQLNYLISQFRVGRDLDTDMLRSELQKTAPHAFAEAKQPAHRSARKSA